MCTLHTDPLIFVSEHGRPRSAHSRRSSAATPTKANTPVFGELIQSASFSVTFAFLVSRLTQLVCRNTQAYRPRPPPLNPQPAQDAPAAGPYLSYRWAKAESASDELAAKRILLGRNPYGALH